MDAAVFPARAHAEPAIAALHGATPARRDFAATAADERDAGRAVGKLEWQAVHGARWIAGINERAGLRGPQRDLCPAERGIANGRTSEPRSRAQHRVHYDAPGIAAAEFAGGVAGAERNTRRGFPRDGAAADAPAGVVDRSAAGIPEHRFAGGARFLSPLHGGRTFVAHDRASAGTGGAA